MILDLKAFKSFLSYEVVGGIILDLKVGESPWYDHEIPESTAPQKVETANPWAW